MYNMDEKMKKFLIADDSTFSRFMIAKLLKNKYKFSIIEASNGEKAIELYKQEQPDIVTMDIMMPICDGIEALKKILDYDKDANIIMCTEIGQSAKVIESTKLGAKGFIIKPIDSNCFFSTIDNIINSDSSANNIKFNEKDILDIHSIESNLIKNKEETISIRLTDNSLIEAGFLKDDLMLIDKSLTPKINDIVLASYKGEFIFGKYNAKELNTVQIKFAHKNYSPIEISEKLICGVVIASVRMLTK